MSEPEEAAAEEVVVRLSSVPRIISPEGCGAGAGAGAGAARAASSAGVELGRRLLLAARAGDTALLLDLMAQGAPFTTDWLGTSALHLAALGGHCGAATVLLRAGVSRDARTKVERTPLHLAAHAGHEPVAGLLLDHGAAVDCRDMLRMTPLHWACARGHAALAALLVRRGADVRARCKFGRSALRLAARGPGVRRAVRAALQERDQAASVRVIQEEMAVDDAAEKSYGAVEMQVPVEEKPNVKAPPKNKPNLDNEQTRGAGGGGGGGGAAGAAAALLRQHGITLLPADDGSTVLSALQSGRTVVLSDAGKLMLKENSGPAPAPAPAPLPSPAPAAGGGGAGGGGGGGAGGARAGVVVRACPARRPPRPGVKVFTVNRRPAPAPHAHTHTHTHTHAPTQTVRADVPDDNQQIKYVHLPADATILSPHRAAMKAKTKVMRPAGAGAAAAAAAGNRPGVKIIMNKASFGKLLATASRAHGSGDNEPLSLGTEGAAPGEAVVCVPEQFVRSSSARYLRAQLLAAHAALAELQRELRHARAQAQQHAQPSQHT